MLIGNEGNYGLVTEAVVRLRPMPEVFEYESAVFPDFQHGTKFFEEVAKSRIWPASMRMFDNKQFQMSQAIKEQSTGIVMSTKEWLKHFYLTKIRGFDFDKLAACTIKFEGTREEVARQRKSITALVLKHNGIVAGAKSGENGYIMTFAIAYVRDFGTDYCFIAESFETSVPWSQVPTLCQRVRERMLDWTKSKGIEYDRIFLSFRVTQAYETGAAVYIYFGFNYGYYKWTKEKALLTMEEIEIECREEVMRQGGSMSHHHGIGKMKKRFLKLAYPLQTNELLNTIKNFYDPKNIFACNNTSYRTP